jgi:hypothetical protein
MMLMWCEATYHPRAPSAKVSLPPPQQGQREGVVDQVELAHLGHT